MAPDAPTATGPRARGPRSPWAAGAAPLAAHLVTLPRREPDAGEWVPTDLGDGRTVWRPPAARRE